MQNILYMKYLTGYFHVLCTLMLVIYHQMQFLHMHNAVYQLSNDDMKALKVLITNFLSKFYQNEYPRLTRSILSPFLRKSLIYLGKVHLI